MSFVFDFNNHKDLDLTAATKNNDLAWLAPLKQRASERFSNFKLPNKKVEHWKYNDMAFLKNTAFTLPDKPTANTIKTTIEASTKMQFERAIELVFIDGQLVSAPDSLKTVRGVFITRYGDTNAKQQALIRRLSEPLANNKNLLTELNAALSLNGLLVEVEANARLPAPIYIKHLTQSQEKPTISTQNTIIQLGKNAKAVVIEQFDSAFQSNKQLSTQQTIIELSEGSALNHYRLNLEKTSSRQVSQVKSTLYKNAVLNSFYLGLGSRLNRTDIDVIHAGTNATCNITGIYLPSKNQHIDYHTNVEHRVPQCHTNEIFRGIVADEAKATFNGKIHIFKDAQKSDAYLNNKNLLLTHKAEINTKPELEIYADDVKCAHGATVAQLDNKALYYLQTRGINQQKATKMLSIAFINELLNQIELEPIKHFLTTQLDNYICHIK